jgi:ankyrin repeat protein
MAPRTSCADLLAELEPYVISPPTNGRRDIQLSDVEQTFRKILGHNRRGFRILGDLGLVLHKAIMYGNYAIAALLLKNGADCKVVNEWKDTPLHQDFRYMAVNEWKDTPLHQAFRYMAVNEWKDTPLHQAFRYMAVNEWKYTPLHQTFRYMAVNEWKDTPLHQAFRYMAVNNSKMIHLLLSQGASINELNEAGKTPLLLPMSRRNSAVVPVIPVLLEHGAEAGISDDEGCTALHYACKWFDCKHEKLAKLLLKRGANVHATNKDGLTPLHWAVQDHKRNGFFMAKFLLDNGADVTRIRRIRRTIAAHCSAHFHGLDRTRI